MNAANHRSQNVRAERFARALLATTCLTVASGAGAQAGTVIEGVGPAPSDFSNSSPGYLLPDGTTQVIGSITPIGDNDWFEIQGLLPASVYTITSPNAGTESGMRLMVSNSSNGTLDNLLIGECCGSYLGQGAVPGDGILMVHVYDAFEAGLPYSFSIDASQSSSTPEPATGAITAAAGLAFASALAWRRRRSE